MLASAAGYFVVFFVGVAVGGLGYILWTAAVAEYDRQRRREGRRR